MGVWPVMELSYGGVAYDGAVLWGCGLDGAVLWACGL